MHQPMTASATNARDELHRVFMSCHSCTEKKLLSIIERLPPDEFISLAKQVLMLIGENASLHPFDKPVVRRNESSGIVTYHSHLEHTYFYRIKFRRQPLSYACIEEVIGAMEIHHLRKCFLFTNTRLSPAIGGNGMIIPEYIKVYDGPAFVKLAIRYLIFPTLP